MNAQVVVTGSPTESRQRRPTPSRRSPVVSAARRTDGPIATTSYVICTNPRSGSCLLSDGLASTSIAGNPREWFNIAQEEELRARWRIDNRTDLTSEGYLEAARLASMTSNGIAGMKLHYYQFADLPRRMEALPGWVGVSPAELLPAMFPGAKYVCLTRRDKVGQAVSFYLASQSNEWWSLKNARVGKACGAADEVGFDPGAIAVFETLLEEHDRGWQAFFESNRITPLVIEYENFASCYAGTIRKVLDWLGVPDADRVAVAAPRLRRQANARSEDWVERYTALKNEQPDLLSALATESAQAALLFTPPDKPFAVIPDIWKQWVAHARLLGDTSEAIAKVLTTNGYSHKAAHAQAENAVSDPYLTASIRHQRRLKKAAALLNAQAQLRRLDSRANAVERRGQLSRNEFRDSYYASNRPVIIDGSLANWTALTSWTPDYLARIAGQSLIEVMTGRDADPRYEMNANRHRSEMRFGAYIDMVYSGKVTNDYYMTANNVFFQRAQTQALLNDLTPLPQDYLKPTVDGRHCFLWFGPAGTVTPLHHDAMNILMAQVVGRKRFRIIAPQHWQCLYNNVGVFSDVDCEAPDLGRHPKFRHAEVAEIVLEPGQALFMPVGWWHQARALDVSMTVTFTNFHYPNHFNWE
jgi:LPS sulfotransferase NodH